MKQVTATFHAYDNEDRECESCFTVSVSEDLTEEERDTLIYRLAPDMAALQGLLRQNVEVVLIEEDN